MEKWTLVKTTGSHSEQIPEAPQFDDEDSAKQWAQDWMAKNTLKKGLEGVGLLKIIVRQPR